MVTARPDATPALRAGAPADARGPTLGLGTWRYGEAAGRRPAESAALREAVRIGYRWFDTAEMYAEGGAESVLGEALAGAMAAGEVTRDELVVVSKVYPHHAGRREMRRACEASLKRLRLASLDLYLLHWRGSVPLAETVAAFEDLRARGLVRRWGVSNFDVDDLEELFAIDGGRACAANQVQHALDERGPEFALLPWHRAHGVMTMSYCPLGQGRLTHHPVLERIGRRHGATAAQVALAALRLRTAALAIPKTSRPDRLRENWGSLALALDADDLAAIDTAFEPPRRKQPLAMT